MVRAALASDAKAIVDIANPMIRNTSVTFTSEEKTVDGVAGLISTSQPFWVAAVAGHVVGYATHFPFRAGPGYARVREHTIGIAPEGRGRGGGRALMEAVEVDAARRSIQSLFAGVSGENADGVAFHAAMGFEEVARLPEVGWKFERWHDLVLMRKRLSGAPSG